MIDKLLYLSIILADFLLQDNEGESTLDNRIKLILCDLDDTLMTSKKEVLPLTRDVLWECSRRGIIIGYVTIRSPRKTAIYTKGLPCDCLANYNGAVIRVKEEMIGNYSIPHNAGLQLITSLQRDYPNASIGAYFEPYSYRDNQIGVIGSEEAISFTPADMPAYDFQRIRIVPGRDRIDITKYITADMAYSITVHGSLIITSSQANKEHATKKIMEHLGIKPSEVLSFGDDYVDIGMLKVSGTGVAMGNAVDAVKEMADYITLTNEEEGIADYLRRYVLSE